MPKNAIPCEAEPDAWFATDFATQFAAAMQCESECPIQAKCKALGRAEEYGVWGGSLPSDPARKIEVRKAKREQRERERAALRADVHKLTADGLNIRQIGEMLGLSVGTVFTLRSAA